MLVNRRNKQSPWISIPFVVWLYIGYVWTTSATVLRIDNATISACSDTSSNILDLDSSSLLIIADQSNQKVVDANGRVYQRIGASTQAGQYEINLPGCLSITLRLKLNSDITSLYLESEINVNGDGDLCSALPENFYCQRSENQLLKEMTHGYSTCAFCNICAYEKRTLRYERQANQGPSLLSFCESSQLKAGTTYEATLGPFCLPAEDDLLSTYPSSVTANLPNPSFQFFLWNARPAVSMDRKGNALIVFHLLDRKNPVGIECLQEAERMLEVDLSESEQRACDRTAHETTDDTYMGCFVAQLSYSLNNA